MGKDKSELDKIAKEDGLDEEDIQLSKFIRRVISQERSRALVAELMKKIKTKH